MVFAEIMPIITSSISAIGIVFSTIFFIAIKTNDLKHIQIAVEKIEQAISRLVENDAKMKESIVKMETRCEERHKM